MTRPSVTASVIASLVLVSIALPAAGSADGPQQSTVFLCNGTREPIIAQYELVTGQSLTLTQALEPNLGSPNDTAACFSVRIPRYTGSIVFTGTFGSRHFATKKLQASFDTPLYVWYYFKGCWQSTVANKACLALQ